MQCLRCGCQNKTTNEYCEGCGAAKVGFGAFRHPGIAIGGRRQAFGHEAAFGADWHDHRVLDLLGLDQAEDLGAEILRPVDQRRPPRATLPKRR